MRLSTLPTAFGEKLVMRIFDPEVLVRNFSDLGFSDEDQGRWKTMAESTAGATYRRARERRGGVSTPPLLTPI